MGLSIGIRVHQRDLPKLFHEVYCARSVGSGYGQRVGNWRPPGRDSQPNLAEGAPSQPAPGDRTT
eukprot:1653572-Pleurochrysis_carterae.AAC.5